MSGQMESVLIERADLVRIVDEASAQGCAQSTRTKLLGVAETTQAVAVGWFHCDGVGCPARQARRQNQAFQQAFDNAMAAHLGRKLDPCDPFVVHIA